MEGRLRHIKLGKEVIDCFRQVKQAYGAIVTIVDPIFATFERRSTSVRERKRLQHTWDRIYSVERVFTVYI